MTKAIDLSQAELAIVRAVLRTRCPPIVGAWALGSRATGNARRYSDVDIALEGSTPLSLDVLGDVAEAVSESELQYNVDIVDLRSVDPAVRTLIEAEMVRLPF